MVTGWCNIRSISPGTKHRVLHHSIPLRSVMVLETMANVGLLYFLFLVGVEMDIVHVIKTSGRKALVIAVTGMILPFLIGVSFSFILHQSAQYVKLGTFIIFLGVALSVTAFPVLARILAELKLVNTEIGKIAMASALLNDMCAWILLAVALAIAENEYWSLNSLLVITGTTAYVVFCVYVVRPLVLWVIQRTPEGEPVSEVCICLILSGVMISGFITDAIGTHSVFGAFVYGLVIPNGPIGATIIERLEDFVLGLLLPLFFAISGLKTDVTSIDGARTWAVLALVIVLASAGKITGTLLVSLFYDIPFYEGITLGLLLNTKGLVEIIVLNVLDDKTFAIMVIVAVVMTSIVQPGVTTLYRPARKRVAYKRRTIQRTKPDGEFRVVVCVHTPRNVPTIIQLLEASHPTKKSPICAYVLHLVELSGRASAVHIVQYTRKSGRPAINRMQAQSDHIFNAFQNFEQQGGFVSVTPFTAISQYSTIHEDICNLAEDKRAALIIIPFHKQQTVDGRMEDTNSSFRMLNQNAREGPLSPFTAGLSDWSECPELGAIGDLLASSDFVATYSVLVLQQYIGMEAIGDTTICMPDSPTQQQGRPDSGQRRSPQQDTAIFHPQP
ncbi:Cation/H(+) antiporter 15 [Sesamum angolense]|uniref:Cation/H(+) antiporter 15 n=1 Tax=Sesamum angolense TaxID=2727404 RepID=A0AAE2BWH9_9LAMI|nr:Cation/H(+) antiporter 15 [Sesamum angolense]